ncbi:hypothetical protein LSAT2_026956, partial [Lamellibrachia satsuma]
LPRSSRGSRGVPVAPVVHEEDLWLPMSSCGSRGAPVAPEELPWLPRSARGSRGAPVAPEELPWLPRSSRGSRHVHSRMLQMHIFVGLPRLRPPLTVPCKTSFA